MKSRFYKIDNAPISIVSYVFLTIPFLYSYWCLLHRLKPFSRESFFLFLGQHPFWAGISLVAIISILNMTKGARKIFTVFQLFTLFYLLCYYFPDGRNVFIFFPLFLIGFFYFYFQYLRNEDSYAFMNSFVDSNRLSLDDNYKKKVFVIDSHGTRRRGVLLNIDASGCFVYLYYRRLPHDDTMSVIVEDSGRLVLSKGHLVVVDVSGRGHGIKFFAVS